MRFDLNFRYFQGLPEELVENIEVPYLLGEQFEVCGIKLQGEQIEGLGVGDRFERSCAYVNVFVRFHLKPLLEKARLRILIYEFLFDNVGDSEWGLVRQALKGYSGYSDKDKIEALRDFISKNSSRLPKLYDNFNLLSKSFHPDALLWVIISKYELGLETHGMTTSDVIHGDRWRRKCAYKEGAVGKMIALLPGARKEKVMIATIGGDTHANCRPAQLPGIIRNAGSLLAGAELIDICKYLNLTIICGTAETIKANKHAFVVEDENGTHGLRGYEFFLNNLREIPVGQARLYIIKNDNGDVYEHRIMFIYNNGQYYSPRNTASKAVKEALEKIEAKKSWWNR